MPYLLLGVGGYVVVGALIEQYDARHATDILVAYTVLVWLTALLAQRQGLSSELPKLIETLRQSTQ